MIDVPITPTRPRPIITLPASWWALTGAQVLTWRVLHPITDLEQREAIRQLAVEYGKTREAAVLLAFLGDDEPLTGRRLERGVAFDHVEVPHLLTTIGACWLTCYISPLTGKPVTVLTVPDNGGGDDPGETYYYFEGMTREQATENERWWLDNIDTMNELLHASVRRRRDED
jgi:hypothetical protein